MAKRTKRKDAQRAAKARRREGRERKKTALQAHADPFHGAWRLPLRGCFINREWQDRLMASILVTRDRRGGDIVAASALVDLGCRRRPRPGHGPGP